MRTCAKRGAKVGKHDIRNSERIKAEGKEARHKVKFSATVSVLERTGKAEGHFMLMEQKKAVGGVAFCYPPCLDRICVRGIKKHRSEGMKCHEGG